MKRKFLPFFSSLASFLLGLAIILALALTGPGLEVGYYVLAAFLLLVLVVVSYLIPYLVLRGQRKDVTKIKDYLEKGERPSDLDEASASLLAELKEKEGKTRERLNSLEEDNRSLEEMLENVGEGIAYFDKDGKMGYANGALLRYFELVPRPERTYTDLMLPEEISRKIAAVQGFRATIDRNGKTYLLTSTPYHEGLIIAVADISYEAKGEDIRSSFSSSLGHELKTPLATIRGFSEILSLQNKDPSLNEAIGHIESEARRLSVLVEDMLRLSRLENTKPSPKNVVDFRQIYNDCLLSLEPTIAKKRTKVSIEGTFSYLMEERDAYFLLKNLIENSLKYGKDGGKVAVVLNKNGFYVEDDGQGIPSESLPRVFERFYRVDASHNRESESTGLGLSIVKHIVLRYGGKVEIQSSLGKGTKVTVSLP